MKHVVCKLCDNTAKLSKSHIYPDFLFKEMKDNKSGKIISFSKNYTYKVIVSPYENLLCAKCETLLNNKYENLMRNFLFGDKSKKIGCKTSKIKEDGYLVEFIGLKSRIIKNFLLSVLWRA